MQRRRPQHMPRQRYGRDRGISFKIEGITGKLGDRITSDLSQPGCEPVFVVVGIPIISLIGNHGTCYTDGKDAWYTCLYGEEFNNPVHSAEVEPSIRGLVRTAVKAYMEGKGNKFRFNGRRMTSSRSDCSHPDLIQPKDLEDLH